MPDAVKPQIARVATARDASNVNQATTRLPPCTARGGAGRLRTRRTAGSRRSRSKLHREARRELVDIGYRALATRLHLDRGGSEGRNVSAQSCAAMISKHSLKQGEISMSTALATKSCQRYAHLHTTSVRDHSAAMARIQEPVFCCAQACRSPNISKASNASLKR